MDKGIKKTLKENIQSGLKNAIKIFTVQDFRKLAMGIQSQIESLFGENRLITGLWRFGDENNYSIFNKFGLLNMIGTARIEKHIRVAAAEWKKGLTAPEEKWEGVFSTLDFSNVLEESAHFTLIVPYSLASGTTIEIEINWLHNSEDAGKVVWGLEYIFLDCDETVKGTTTKITQASTGSHTEGELICTTAKTKLTGVIAEELLGLRIYRDIDDENDTLGEDARMVEVHFHYTSDKLGEPT